MTRFIPLIARRWLSGLTVIALTVLACEAPTEPAYVPLTERDLSITPTGASLSGMGATALFTLVDSTGAPVPADSVAWFSLAPAIATIDAANGLVTAVAAGQAVVGARIDTVVVGYGLATVSIVGAPVRSWVADTLVRPDLYGIWGRADDDVFVVGEYQLIYHYDGSRWRRQHGGGSMRMYPHPGDLLDVTGTPAGPVFAVGPRPRYSYLEPGGVLRYEDEGWTREQVGDRNFVSLAAVSSTDFVAVDQYGKAYHFDGSTWHSMGGGSSGDESVVWGSSPTDVFVGGAEGRISHYDGTSWTAMESGTTYAILSLWGTGADNVYAGGGGIHHYDGDGWSDPTTGFWTGSIQAFTGRSVDDVWGTGRVYLDGSWRQAVLHYDGAEWNAQVNEALVRTQLRINDLWMSPIGSLYGVSAEGGLVTRKDDAWALDNIGAGPEQVHGLWGIHPEQVFRVGIGRKLQLGTTTAGWVDPCGLDIGWPIDVWAAASHHVFAVGEYRELLHLQEGYCSSGVLPGSGKVAAIWGASPDDVWAVGEPEFYWNPPVLFHLKRGNWLQITPSFLGGQPYFQDIWGLASDAIWAVGRVDSTGGVWHFNGTYWHGQAVPEGGPLTSVWGPDPANVFAVGTGGRILHYDGTEWTAMVSPDTADLNAVWGMAPTDVYAAGDGVVLHFDGTAWTPVEGAPDTYYTAIWGSSTGPVYFGAEGQFIAASR